MTDTRPSRSNLSARGAVLLLVPAFIIAGCGRIVRRGQAAHEPDAGGVARNEFPAGGPGVPVGFVRHPANPLYESSRSSWNFAGIGDPTAIYDTTDTLYKMWSSAAGVVPPRDEVIVRIQYLTSADGITWSEWPANPVLPEGDLPDDWDHGGVETAGVLRDGGTFWMWYAGYEVRESPPLTMKIGVATSSDGIAWTKSDLNPVLENGAPGEWDESWVESPTVVKVGGAYIMWYTGVRGGTEFAIGLATSPDGEIWAKYPGNPVFRHAPDNDWEDGLVYAPSVVYDGRLLRMYYVGLNAATYLDARRIGMATSADGIHWQRCRSNPVLGLGPPGEWDEKGPFVPTVLRGAGGWEMFYLSGEVGDEKIGLATSRN